MSVATRSVRYSRDPVIEWVNDRELFRVWVPFLVYWHRPHAKLWTAQVPTGFFTDLASIPGVLESFISRVGRHIQAAITHDYCYHVDTGLTRSEADLLFLDGMEASGVDEGEREAMYSAVRWMGASSWKHTPDATDNEEWEKDDPE